MDRRIDLALAGFIVALGVFVIVTTTKINNRLALDSVGPRAFWYAVGIALVIGGAIVSIGRLMTWKRGEGNLVTGSGAEEDEPGISASAVRAFALIGDTFLYAALFNPLGYLLATPLYIVSALAIMGERRWLRTALVALIFTVGCYYVFAQVLGARLPVGPFTDLFRSLGWVNL